MELNLNQLQTFLNQNEIPKIKGKPKTFLGITKQPHYENVLSNIYAFYFKVNEVHRFKDLFVTSLLACIAKSKLGKQKEALQEFYDFEVDTEYATIKGGRIDLLLSNKEQAIIIENKVYHHLNNNLDDYWNSIDVEDKNEDNKIGIVLSLQPVSDIKHPQFINITHLELLQTVMKNCGTYLLEANNKYLVFLKDFYQNIMNLSKPIMEQKELDFYFKNQEEINQIIKLKLSVRNHIINEVEKAGNSLEDVNLYGPRVSSALGKRVRYYLSLFDKNLMIAVVFDEIMTDKKFYIAVEFMDNCLIDRVKYQAVNFNDSEKSILVPDFYSNTNKHWAHFAVKHYSLKDEDVTNLSDFILDKLENDSLLSIFRKLEAFLENNKK